ncbi:hypothetical protein NYE59_24050 [Paenibacillus sp. FSL L8-0323]|jgi:hypothetical protein|uniref:hypothetical protein n=1 Tax=Paenibacillus sp. FSL L8-0323 TaxID=2975330 RepID=UPI0030F4CDDA
MSDQEREIRVNLLDGSEVIMNTGDRVLFQASSPWAIPLSVDTDTIIDDVLAALEESQQEYELIKFDRDALVKLVANHQSAVDDACRELAEAQQTVSRQREVLEFYADQEHWELPSFGRGQSKVTSDRGSKARELLKEGSDKA